LNQSRAAYFRERRAVLKKTKCGEQKRLFREGAEGLRKLAIETFRRIGSGELTGYTAMDIIRELKLSE
jgi:hypothetical protein